MFSRLKKKLTEIKTDLNHKIDHLEVDKNQILNKTQRSIDPLFAQNGTAYLLKKDADLMEIQKICRENEQLCDTFDQSVKQCLLHATNFYHGIRTIEKELGLMLKSINTFKSITDKLEQFCFKLNEDFFILEEIYEDLFLEKKIKEAKEKAEKEKVQNDIDLSNQMDTALQNFLEEEEIGLNDESVKLKISMEDE